MFVSSLFFNIYSKMCYNTIKEGNRKLPLNFEGRTFGITVSLNTASGKKANIKHKKNDKYSLNFLWL